MAIIVGVQLLTRGRPSEELPAVVSQPAPATPRAPPRVAAPTPPPGPAATTEVRAPEPPAAGGAAAPAQALDGSRRFMFDCGNGVIFSVRTVPGEATLLSPQALGAEVVTLPQIEAASGARYVSGDVGFWSRGGLATFEIRGRTFADCTSNPGAAQTAEARRRGATFRARGNEPAWLLEVSQERIELATRARHAPHRLPVPRADGQRSENDVSHVLRHAGAARRPRSCSVQRHHERRGVRDNGHRHVREPDVVRLRAAALAHADRRSARTSF